jgi:hypothetical protein
MEYEGFHGTNRDFEELILIGNFNVSADSDEWLGTGAYFFIDGISDPKEDAKNWAKLQAYDSDIGKNTYHRFSVVSAKINVSQVLRLDTDEGMKAFNEYRDRLIDLMKRNGIRPKKSMIESDCEICNHIFSQSGFEAIINNEFIQLDLWSRRTRYRSRMPVCKIMSVKDPSTSVDINDIAVVQRGRV